MILSLQSASRCAAGDDPAHRHFFSMSKDATVDEAVREERWRVHSRVPVFGEDSDDVVGSQSERRLEELMFPAHFVPEIAPLDKVMLDF